MMKQKKLYAIDLFSGCGGITAGLKKAGIEVRAAVEIDDTAIKTYEYNHKGVVVIQKNICEVSGNELRKAAGISDEDILLLVGCPPCQGFSSIRKGGEQDQRNQLVFEFIRLAKELKPEFILMENVAGMSRGKGKKTFQEAYKEFCENYECKYDILNAADYGVPQTRKRLVLHGIRKDVYDIWKNQGVEIDLPQQTHIAPSKKKEKNNCDLPEWIKANVILGLPEIEAGMGCQEEGIFNHTCNNMTEINIQRIQFIRKHGGSRTCLPPNLALPCHDGKSGHTDVYGIMDMDKPAPTITGGCMYYSKGRYGHPEQDRALSAREAARLQSFDDDYKFFGNNCQIALQIGNAVPVELAKASGKYFVDLYHTINSCNNKQDST